MFAALFLFASAATAFTAPRTLAMRNIRSAAMKDIVDTAVGAGSFGTLIAAVGAAGLVDTLKSKGPFTVFAPTDAAFAALPKGTVESLLLPENKAKLAGILMYHVVAGKVVAATAVTLDGKAVATVNGAEMKVTVKGGSVFFDNAKVVTTDIECANGVIHVIDAVILPAAPLKDIADTAVGAGSFGTLVAAIDAAGLVDKLKSKGPFTVFAPTDAAFAALPKGTVESLLVPENKAKLAAILTYHVVAGKVMAATAVTLDGKSVATGNGKELKVTVEGGSVFVDAAKVVTTDIECANGVIHVIDAVILPQ
ncbi:FAS1 domain-containing protein [Pelagophyceae sp. CCMP2097]|nr:FAS1 domain-containing protein [Pelagophyceae sp. CCMP2097]